VLQKAYDRATRDRQPDARLAAVRALAARAEALDRDTALDRGAVLALLEKLAKEGPYLVRRQATAALVTLGQDPEPLGSPKSRRTVDVYRQIVLRTQEPRRVALDTERGTVEVEVDCPAAPLTCLSFLQLAEQGFYDDQPFHRVVPDFVVQGGDPRGDGAGGPGYTLRDEIGLLRYGPVLPASGGGGVLGMAHAGAHTAGSQFFLTLSEQPHLDGGYTAFGRVVNGQEVLESLLQGDRLVRARVLDGGSSAKSGAGR
jgi:cyclophilin family peptidyl-prolyl cis-trans isomerase